MLLLKLHIHGKQTYFISQDRDVLLLKVAMTAREKEWETQEHDLVKSEIEAGIVVNGTFWTSEGRAGGWFQVYFVESLD